MSDEQGKNVRRVGKDDQKKRIKSKPLSLSPDSTPEEQPETDSAPPEEMRFAPPEAQKLPRVPLEEDEEADIPTTQVKVKTPPEDRYPPIAPPRDLPPHLEQSPNLYPQKKPQTQPKSNRGARLLANLLTLVVLLGIGGVIAYGVYIYQNPYSALNPLAPATPFPVVITATFLPPTETTTPTFTAVAVGAALDEDNTPTVNATVDTRLITPTLPPVEETVIAPAAGGSIVTFTPSPTTSPQPTESPFAFLPLQPFPLYTPNGNGRGCEWASIAGTVVDLNGEPINGLGVRFVEQLTEEENTVFTGSSATFGEGGFEFIISTAPVENGYSMQLLSPAGAPLSDIYTIVSSDQCNQTVAVINFEQVKPY